MSKYGNFNITNNVNFSTNNYGASGKLGNINSEFAIDSTSPYVMS